LEWTWYNFFIIFKRKKVNGEYYANLLRKFYEKIKRKRPHLAKKNIQFHQGIAPDHMSLISRAKVHKVCIAPPHHFTECSPRNFHPFPSLKKWLGGKRFVNDIEVIDAVNHNYGNLETQTISLK
jgi:hypothetical protein